MYFGNGRRRTTDKNTINGMDNAQSKRERRMFKNETTRPGPPSRIGNEWKSRLPATGILLLMRSPLADLNFN